MRVAVVRVRQGIMLPLDHLHHVFMGEDLPSAEIVFGGIEGEALRLDAVVAVERLDFLRFLWISSWLLLFRFLSFCSVSLPPEKSWNSRWPSETKQLK